MTKYDAILIIEKIQNKENDAFKRYAELNGADIERSKVHDGILYACAEFMHEIAILN